MADPTRLLLIEDDPDDARLVTGMLADTGGARWEISCAGSPGEATDYLENHQVDAVLLDLGLPGGECLDTFRKVRSLKPNLPVIVLSEEDEEEAIRFIREGSQDFLVKSRIEPDRLMRSIRYAIERKRNEQARTQFINNAAHELRTPLSILKISVHNLNKHFAGSMPEQQQKMLLVAEKHIDRLMRFINNLLDFARLEAGRGIINRCSTDVGPILRDVVQSFGVEAAEKNLEIESSIPPDLPEVSIDGAMIERVLGNILSNALHFAKQTIRVEARLLNGNGDRQPGMEPAPGAADSGKPSEMQGLLVSVTDDGAGIPRDRIGELFGKFAQIRNNRQDNGYKGTGLGLAISREIMEKHQAHIWAESTPGRGATFRLLFPN